jgi:hypothetical protein
VSGSLKAADLGKTGLQECPLSVAVRDPRLWAVVPDLMSRGAKVRACERSPLVELAQANPCPDFKAASPDVLRSLRNLAESDDRAVHHDVVRMLSCPAARQAGLDTILSGWLDHGKLRAGQLGFGPLGALHPDYLGSPLALALEAQGHTAQDALGGYDGVLPSGYEEALRLNHRSALSWWLSRRPDLVNRVPAGQGNQLAWVPLARVLVPTFLADPASQADMVEFLLAHGANPRQKLPHDPATTVLQQARLMRSPMLGLIEPSATSLAVHGTGAAQP